MGEYASYRDQRIKVGTCEDMYYLRYDQRYLVHRLSGNVDPVKDAAELRFRFPWPDEDDAEPGSDKFSDYSRSVWVPGLSASTEVQHYTVQFVASAGYNVCLPCPESGKTPAGLTVHRNGFGGAVRLVAQKYREGIGLVPILKCGGCGAMWRTEDRAGVEEIAMLLRAEADRQEHLGRHNGTGKQDRKFLDAVADRVLAGINATAAGDLIAAKTLIDKL
jgi:hypothetical protein